MLNCIHLFPLCRSSDNVVLSVCQQSQRNLEAQIEALLNVEKQMRLAGDVAGTKKAVCDILQLCFEAKAWKTLNDQIVLLSKRRGQLKQVKDVDNAPIKSINQNPSK